MRYKRIEFKDELEEFGKLIKLTTAVNKYYYYTVLTQLRFTKIVNILFIIQSVGLGLVKFALLQSIFLFSQLIFELPSGILGDLLNKKNRNFGRTY